MRVLLLTQIIPFPLDAGPKVKTWHVIRYLIEKGHEVDLVSFLRLEEKPYVPEIQRFCRKVYPVPITRSKASDVGYLLRSFTTGKPFLIERDSKPEMHRLVKKLISENDYDVIHADQLTMTQFVPHDNRADHPKTVFDAHNAVWTIVQRMAANAPWYQRVFAYNEAERVKRYEGKLVQDFDYTFVVTDQDQKQLAEAAVTGKSQKVANEIRGLIAPRLNIIPIAVDTIQLQPIQHAGSTQNIVTLGTLHYPPNADGIRWFLNEVFPLIKKELPAASLTIIGKNPPEDFIRTAAQNPQSITVTGYVPEIQPYFSKADLVVVPVRAGGGMRVRILEAFALGMPVVTTSIGLEGIQADNEEEVCVRDTAPSFAEAVIRLLLDEDLRKKLSTKSRQLAINCYDWRTVLNKLDNVYSA